MALHQSVARHGFVRQAQQARALNKQRTIAPHVLESTVEYADLDKDISLRRCTAPRLVGQVVLVPGQQFFAVKSKFAGRYYIVAKQNGKLTCSCKDERTATLMIAKVKAFIAERQAA